MHKTRLVSVLLLVSLSVVAQDEPGPPSLPDALSAGDSARVTLPSRSAGKTVEQVFFHSGMKSAKPVLVVDHDAEGVPVKLALDPPSGNEALDQAILAWGSQIRLTPGKIGTGRIPFDFSSEIDEASPSPYGTDSFRIDFQRLVLKAPSLTPLMNIFKRTNLSKVSTELLIDYDVEGDVVAASLSTTTNSGGLDKALLTWAKGLKFKPGVAGSWRLPIKLEIK